jgi:hypothetical protein
MDIRWFELPRPQASSEARPSRHKAAVVRSYAWRRPGLPGPSGQVGGDLEQHGEGLSGHNECGHRVECDHELAPVELDGAGGELDEVDESRNLLELAACAMAKRMDLAELVEVFAVCHFGTFVYAPGFVR